MLYIESLRVLAGVSGMSDNGFDYAYQIVEHVDTGKIYARLRGFEWGENYGTQADNAFEISRADADKLIAYINAGNHAPNEIAEEMDVLIGSYHPNLPAGIYVVPRPSETDQGTARGLLDRAIEITGLSVTKLAEDVLVRDVRTVRRWREGRQTIPEIAVRKLRSIVDSETPRP